MVLYAFAALADVVPGGWRLRSFLESPAARQARETAQRSEHRETRLAGFAREPAPPPGGVLFIGSSTIELFDLERAFGAAGVAVVQRGIGDEEIALLEERFLTTLVRVEPSVVVLYAASVDVRRPTREGRFADGERLAERVLDLVDLALEGDPERRVVVLGTLPETDDHRGVRARADSLVRHLRAGVEARPRATLVPLARPPLVDEDTGLLNPAYARDRLHLNERGYEHVASWLRAEIPVLATSNLPKRDTPDSPAGQSGR